MSFPLAPQFILATTLLLVSSLVPAHDVKHGSLTIAHPFVRVDPACDGDRTRAYVMLVINQGKRAERLLGAELAGGVRGTILAPSGPGDAGTRRVTGVDIPANGRTALMPPALVIEFPQSSKTLPTGSVVAGTLHFERAGTVPVSFMVEAAREPGKACGATGTAPAGARPQGHDGEAHHHKH